MDFHQSPRFSPRQYSLVSGNYQPTVPLNTRHFRRHDQNSHRPSSLPVRIAEKSREQENDGETDLKESSPYRCSEAGQKMNLCLTVVRKSGRPEWAPAAGLKKGGEELIRGIWELWNEIEILEMLKPGLERRAE
ncbi:hypothetical protein SDJN03_01696, partial [Cucurbita argyrosperma subsp. sororia]